MTNKWHKIWPRDKVASKKADFQILIVDDNPEMLWLLEKSIKPFGYSVIQASDCQTAVKWFESGNIHLVISDIVMPGENGIALLKRIRNVDKDLPVFLFSGVADNYLEEAMRAGASRVFRKDNVSDLASFVNVCGVLAMSGERMVIAQN